MNCTGDADAKPIDIDMNCQGEGDAKPVEDSALRQSTDGAEQMSGSMETLEARTARPRCHSSTGLSNFLGHSAPQKGTGVVPVPEGGEEMGPGVVTVPSMDASRPLHRVHSVTEVTVPSMAASRPLHRVHSVTEDTVPSMAASPPLHRVHSVTEVTVPSMAASPPLHRVHSVTDIHRSALSPLCRPRSTDSLRRKESGPLSRRLSGKMGGMSTCSERSVRGGVPKSGRASMSIDLPPPDSPGMEHWTSSGQRSLTPKTAPMFAVLSSAYLCDHSPCESFTMRRKGIAAKGSIFRTMGENLRALSFEGLSAPSKCQSIYDATRALSKSSSHMECLSRRDKQGTFTRASVPYDFCFPRVTTPSGQLPPVLLPHGGAAPAWTFPKQAPVYRSSPPKVKPLHRYSSLSNMCELITEDPEEGA
eukprot:gene1248-32596_t